uniref:Uncharacterized protein n=1 Tax=Clandestinovirus TaxID=2831644 RepID=A0A8F8PKF1_9VIRU|nr:hypothetical protein KOM_12_443 [Clandestinovirus]
MECLNADVMKIINNKSEIERKHRVVTVWCDNVIPAIYEWRMLDGTNEHFTEYGSLYNKNRTTAYLETTYLLIAIKRVCKAFYKDVNLGFAYGSFATSRYRSANPNQ